MKFLLIREAVVSAVCGKESSKLAGCIQRLAKVIPSETLLLRTGIGHLISDRHLWGLAGHTVQRRAAALHAKWRLHFRRARSAGCEGGLWPRSRQLHSLKASCHDKEAVHKPRRSFLETLSLTSKLSRFEQVLKLFLGSSYAASSTATFLSPASRVALVRHEARC